jgi:cytochrome c biogenesis protein CcmG/thiol:disulfide interchange protein DsbE
MKEVTVFLALCFASLVASAQTTDLPYAELTTIDGLPTNTDEIIEKGAVTILVFWKSCNQKCSESLEAMQEIWQDSLEHNGVKLIAICVDGVGTWDHVKPFVFGNSWEFDTYIDVNCDLKRAMNVSNLPCTILLDDNQNLICRHEGFCTGVEAMLCEKIQKHLYASLD